MVMISVNIKMPRMPKESSMKYLRISVNISLITNLEFS